MVHITTYYVGAIRGPRRYRQVFSTGYHKEFKGGNEGEWEGGKEREIKKESE